MGSHRRATSTMAGSARRRGNHRKSRPARVRTGLLSATTALALGSGAVVSGLVPGLDGGLPFGDSSGPSTSVQADASPDTDLHEHPSDRADHDASSRSGEKRKSPSPSDQKSKRPATKSADESEGGEKARASDRPAEKAAPSTRPSRTPSAPQRTTPAAPDRPSSPPDSVNSSAERQVLSLVNQERAKAGCRPVRADGQLTSLARDFSKDMAARGFFSHTDPDGNSPWDRAEARGIKNMGGENIARGQANAQAVMNGWMNSPGHRANILNCDFTSLGVGAHFAQGGPWWTQAFGF